MSYQKAKPYIARERKVIKHHNRDTEEVWYSKIVDRHGSDVCYTFMDVYTYGVEKEDNHDDKNLKKSMGICLMSDKHGEEMSDENQATVSEIEGDYTQILRDYFSEEIKGTLNYRKTPFVCPRLQGDKKSGVKNNLKDGVEDFCNMYPRILPENILMLDTEGNIVKPEALTRQRVNLTVRMSSVRGTGEQRLHKPMFDVVAVELLKKKNKKIIGITDPNAIHKEMLKQLAIEGCGTEYFDPDYKFDDVLNECKAYIAGSFLLQIVHGERYEDSDIDIFCPSRRVSTLLSYFFQNPHTTIKKMYGVKLPENYMDMKVPIENIIDIRGTSGRKIQIISLLVDDVNKHIENSFDFSFCKIRWDGKKLYPEDLTNIARKVGVINVYSRYRPDRLNKYIDRGYKFTLDFTRTLSNVNLKLHIQHDHTFLVSQKKKENKDWKNDCEPHESWGHSDDSNFEFNKPPVKKFNKVRKVEKDSEDEDVDSDDSDSDSDFAVVNTPQKKSEKFGVMDKKELELSEDYNKLNISEKSSNVYDGHGNPWGCMCMKCEKRILEDKSNNWV
jgi:hypothetical protein